MFVGGAAAMHKFSTAGKFTVAESSIIDSHGTVFTNPVTQTVTVGSPPAAHFTLAQAAPYTGPSYAGGAITFDGSSSTDPNAPAGTINSYSWSFGDGATATGATANHTYAAAGSFTVTLNITDSLGFTASTQLAVTVQTPSKVTGATLVSSKGHYFAAVTATGAGTVAIGSQSATLTGAGTVNVPLTLTSSQLKTLSKGKSVSLSVTVVFTPQVGPASSTPETFTIKGSKRHHKKRHKRHRK
jgi:large repetitive protein